MSLTFSLKYLVNFCKASALSSQVKICLSNEVPLLVEYSVQGTSWLRFYLAPKVGLSLQLERLRSRAFERVADFSLYRLAMRSKWSFVRCDAFFDEGPFTTRRLLVDPHEMSLGGGYEVAHRIHWSRAENVVEGESQDTALHDIAWRGTAACCSIRKPREPTVMETNHLMLPVTLCGTHPSPRGQSAPNSNVMSLPLPLAMRAECTDDRWAVSVMQGQRRSVGSPATAGHLPK